MRSLRHQAHGRGDCLRDAALLRGRAGERSLDVHEREHRHAEALGHAHDPHRLAVALGVRQAEVAADVLFGVLALLEADDGDAPVADPGQAGDHRRVVAEEAVAVQLDELVRHALEKLERVRALEVSRLLDVRPDRGLGVLLVCVGAVAAAQ